MKTFEFRGCETEILKDARFEHVNSVWMRTVTSNFSSFYDPPWQPCDVRLFGQIKQVLGNLPLINASHKLRISWEGDCRFPAEVIDEDMQKYRDVVRKLESGLKK
jgi:hypothetical protein